MKKLRIAQPLPCALKWAKNVEVKEIMVLEGISVLDQGIISDINHVIYIHVT